jgi:hypothetical protein
LGDNSVTLTFSRFRYLVVSSARKSIIVASSGAVWRISSDEMNSLCLVLLGKKLRSVFTGGRELIHRAIDAMASTLEREIMLSSVVVFFTVIIVVGQKLVVAENIRWETVVPNDVGVRRTCSTS